VTASHQAAVAVVLRQRPLAEVLLIRRAHHPRDPWSGHMALPGGRMDAGDVSLLGTALRETREEVGIDLAAEGELLGRLSTVPAIARGQRMDMTITPFVFALEQHPEVRPNHEVQEVIWTPLGPLADGRAADSFSYEHEGRQLEMPAWNVQGRIVWGLTHRMLTQLLELLWSDGDDPRRPPDVPAASGNTSERM
jgi:8-oxo-dGTP pyrophosphatase MutT (NUDIX family)